MREQEDPSRQSRCNAGTCWTLVRYVAFLRLILLFDKEENVVTKKRTNAVVIKSRLYMIKTNQPTKPKSVISNKIPKVNLKKTSSFPKKARPRNIAFIKKYMTEATIPIARDLNTFKFM